MACHLAGAKPLPEPMLEYYYQFDPWEQTSINPYDKSLQAVKWVG